MSCVMFYTIALEGRAAWGRVSGNDIEYIMVGAGKVSIWGGGCSHFARAEPLQNGGRVRRC